MSLSRNKLYLLLTIACIAGYSWLYFGISASSNTSSNYQVCVIKHVTGVPCPSCGSTRSVISIVHGDFLQALNMNPFGYLISAILLIAPLWILMDLFRRKDTLYTTIKNIEMRLNKPNFSIPLIVLVLVNWIWNIHKGL